MADKLTLTTIADMCGVSPTTVSLILNNKPAISDEIRIRVLAAAQQIGHLDAFKPVSRKDGRLTSVGMVVKTDTDLLPSANPFYSQIIAGVDDACRDMGLNLLFAMLPVNRNNQPLNVPPLLENSIVDGLLMVGTFVDSTIHAILGRRRLPIILVDGYSDTESYDMVVSDNFGAAYQAVEHLIKLGHRHIGLVGSEPDCYPSLNERRNGYLRALKDNDISASYIANLNINRSKGEEETVRLLTEHPHITALFCVNDDIALGALRAAQRLARQVPRDLSIMGYDDTYLATSIRSTLSTMRVDTLAMGRAAVHLLALRLEKPDAARSTFTVHPELVTRESTAALA